MRETSLQGETAFDPFGEPMDPPKACAETKGRAETRRAAVVFWVLALLLVIGRACLSEPQAGQGATVTAPAGVQVSSLR